MNEDTNISFAFKEFTTSCRKRLFAIHLGEEKTLCNNVKGESIGIVIFLRFHEIFLLTPLSSLVLISAAFSTWDFTASRSPCLAATCKEYCEGTETKTRVKYSIEVTNKLDKLQHTRADSFDFSTLHILTFLIVNSKHVRRS